MLRIRYQKTKHGIKSNQFPISDKLILTIEISNDAELFVKNAEQVVYVELCTSVRNAKYRARKKLAEYGFPVLTEMRKRRKE